MKLSTEMVSVDRAGLKVAAVDLSIQTATVGVVQPSWRVC